MFKIRRSRDRLIFNMEIPISEQTVFILRRAMESTITSGQLDFCYFTDYTIFISAGSAAVISTAILICGLLYQER